VRSAFIAGALVAALVGVATLTAARDPNSAVGNPFAGARFFVDGDSDAAWAERNLRDAGRLADATAMRRIAAHPWADWFGDWSNGHGSLYADVRARVDEVTGQGALPVLVAYDIPDRDCGSYSAGGAASFSAYLRWIDQFARAIGNRSVVVVLEPDALAELDCHPPARRQAYLRTIRTAVATLAVHRGVAVYIDAGNESWVASAVMAKRLRAAGIAGARGFALNVSNFYSTRSEERYGDRISALVGGKHFIVDTSRNGDGPAADGVWCNPPGRALGTPATTRTDDPLADAYFWIKAPGESDGSCRGGPRAGDWWLDYALALARTSPTKERR
jgi:endoglucanase